MAITQKYIGNQYFPARYFATGYWPYSRSVTPVPPPIPDVELEGMMRRSRALRHQKISKIKADDSEVVLILAAVFPTFESCQH